MPDSRHHRGAHPEDEKLFGVDQLPRLRQACSDLSWLYTRGYASKSALKLVGDRFCLTERQRTAIGRCACSEQMVRSIELKCEIAPKNGRAEVWIDGYNVLTSVEAALAGGVILHARDDCYRDMASMHGTWRRVDETLPALGHLGEVLIELGVQRCRWLLDRPVSNSGRLAEIVTQFAAARGWRWTVDLVADPDLVLAECKATVATSDREILTRCSRWLNLAKAVIDSKLSRVWLIDLSEH